MKLFSQLVVLACIFAVVACRDSIAPDQSVAVGSYALESVSGRGPATGSMVLVPGGQAERRVRYRQPDGTLSSEYVAIGTFRVTDTQSVELGLREDGGSSQYVWRVTATLDDGILNLGYPDPADGWIVETYRRQ